VHDKVCMFYLQPRGCIKGASCDFKHPALSNLGFGGGGAAAAPVATSGKVCEYFLKARGCNKGEQCDFLHPDVLPEQKMLLQAQLPRKGQPCQYFATPRGCIKGNTCDFLHPASAMGAPFAMSGVGGGAFGGGFGLGLGGAQMQMSLGGAAGPKICEFFPDPAGLQQGHVV